MIDSHHHLWRYSDAEYPSIPADSPLAKDYLISELENVTQEAGVTGTIVVQARQKVEESDFLLALANESELVQTVVGWLPLTGNEVEDCLEKYSAHHKFKAVHHLLDQEPDEYFLRDDFHHGLSLLPAFGLSYDLQINQRQLPLAAKLLDRQPELPVILNHIAKPTARNGKVDPKWRKGMKELAKRDNLIAVKFSGLLNQFPENEGDLKSITAYFHETLEIFGPGNIMFGTNWPTCLLRSSYLDWVDVVKYLTEILSAPEKQAVHQENAEICYRL